MNVDNIIISVIICTMNRENDLLECIESISQQTLLPHEVLIIDDGAIDQEYLEKYKKLLEPKRVNFFYKMKTKNNKGLTFSRNLGMKYAIGDYIMFLDDDVVIEKNYIANIMDIFLSHRGVGGVGGYDWSSQNNIGLKFGLMKLFFLSSHKRGVLLRSGKAVHTGRLNNTTKVEFLLGYNMTYKAEVFKDNLFEERWGIYCDGEDIDFSYRISRIYKLYLTPYAKLIHKQSPNTIFRESNTKAVFMSIFNRFFIVCKLFPRNICTYTIYFWSLFGYFIHFWSKKIIIGNTKNYGSILSSQFNAFKSIINILLKRSTFECIYNSLYKIP